jgi:hypothetical protein
MTSDNPLAEALAKLDTYLADMGSCGDGNCIVMKPKGQHTNGGCRCCSQSFRMQKYAYAHNRFTEQVRAILLERTGDDQ